MPRENRIGEFAAGLPALMRQVQLQTAERIVEGAKERVPVDPNAETHLRDAIHVHEDEDGVSVVAGNREHWWGHILEHGSVKMAPRPFLMPAVEEQTAQFVEDSREALRRAAQ